MFESRTPANMARFTYLDPRARDFFTDWNRTAKGCVAALRTQAGRDPFDRDLANLVGELSTRCEEFAALWATHDVRLHRKAEKHFHHPLAGDLTLRYERLAVAADPGLEIFACMAEPGSRSEEALSFLALPRGRKRFAKPRAQQDGRLSTHPRPGDLTIRPSF